MHLLKEKQGFVLPNQRQWAEAFVDGKFRACFILKSAIFIYVGMINRPFCAVNAQNDANLLIHNFTQALAHLEPSAEVDSFFLGTTSLPDGGHLQGIQPYYNAEKRGIFLTGSSSNQAYALYAEQGPHPMPASFVPLTPDPLRHAGGFQIMGDYLIVGVEDNYTRTSSALLLYDLYRGLEEGPNLRIAREGPYERATAGAVAGAKWDDKHLLIVGTWNCESLDFYHSNGLSLSDPQCKFLLEETWYASKADRTNWSDPNFGSYQNLNLVIDTLGNVFLAGFCSEEGKQILDVFTVNDAPEIPVTKRIRKTLRMILPFRHTDFSKGAGLHVQAGNQLEIWACTHNQSLVEKLITRYHE